MKTPYVLHSLTVPDEPDLQAALGRLAIAHTHLEFVLRYCVKTIADLSVEGALDATEGERISDLREAIKRLFKERRPTEIERTSLNELLGRAKRFSRKRNEYLHRVWSQTEAGKAIVATEDHGWKKAPSKEEIDSASQETLELVAELNFARNEGFISEVIRRHINGVASSHK